MDTLRQDLVYSLRRLRQSPGFTAIAIATLALGIGANSAIFSVVHAVLLRPLPFPAAERLVNLGQVGKDGESSVFTPPNFLDVVAQSKSYDGVAAYDATASILGSGGAPVRVINVEVSSSFFDVLGVQPQVGRNFQPQDNEPGQHRVVILGHALWVQRFGSNPAVVGTTIQLDREPFLVAGVAPAGVVFPEGTELWTPLQYDEDFKVGNRGAWYLSVVGRLRDGVAATEAHEELRTIMARLETQYPQSNKNVSGAVDPLQQFLVGETRAPLLMLLGAVGFVLLIACVNVANLLLARVAGRETEIALRSALGAGRGRIVRQLLTESVTLALVGGAAGVLLAWQSLDALLALQPENVPRLKEVHVDRTVIGFAALMSLGTGLLFGAFPALQATRRSTAVSLREGARGLFNARGGGLRSGLVVGQMALAMILLAGAGLLVRSFDQLRKVDPGFRTERALTFRLALPESAYPEDPQRIAFHERLQERLRAVPGVDAVGAVVGLPLSGMAFNLSFDVKGRPKAAAGEEPSLEVRVATPSYFEAVGIPLVRGRLFDARDGLEQPQVALISQAAAQKFFPGEDPIGRFITLGWGRGENKPRVGGTVVGILGDVKEAGLAEDYPPEIYVPYAQATVGSMDLLVRTRVDPMSVRPQVERVVHDLDPELAMARVKTLEDIVARSISEPRFYMLLLSAFAAVALFLAGLGVFGVMSYAVMQRSREIGIRMALGAESGEVLRMVMSHALLLCGSGVLIGLAGAIALSRVVASLLFNLEPTDPLTLGTVAVVLVSVALLASFLPARRATLVDPMIALRSE